MNPIEFSQRLLQAKEGSPEAAALARDLVEDARYPASFVLQSGLTSPDQADQMKAKHVLAELGELALAPLAQSAPWPDLDTELWALRTMAEEFMDFRQQVASTVKDLLSNRRRAASLLEGLSTFQPPPGTRVCDLAFILLHGILHLQPSPSGFLGTSPNERDRKISEFQQSRMYRSAFEGQL